MNTALLLIALLIVKHFIADFVLQSEWQVRNKARYGHPAGLLHAGFHAVLTLPCLLAVGVAPVPALAAVAVEFVLHYHQDWLKEQITRRGGAGPERQIFWIVLGADQLLHQLFYVAMVFLLLGNR